MTEPREVCKNQANIHDIYVYTKYVQSGKTIIFHPLHNFLLMRIQCANLFALRSSSDYFVPEKINMYISILRH